MSLVSRHFSGDDMLSLANKDACIVSDNRNHTKSSLLNHILCCKPTICIPIDINRMQKTHGYGLDYQTSLALLSFTKDTPGDHSAFLTAAVAASKLVLQSQLSPRTYKSMWLSCRPAAFPVF